ncbi:hypothetical protein I2485_14930 [Nesterenkonia sp. E16_7]|uniref:hypothetical protein n=1 Tax=unclassified Nesterenkonia TaxID=2629769 RepID=UPI001A91A6A6|nr:MULTISPECIES: hypothetical protein [unclassified Nesterenkonia]MBO0596770.1 hypothetical protein [Nesterenkonia sp. E16_10]MBO0599943.1 hypothetical protein [Nesterenkonia sp. E16_7]
MSRIITPSEVAEQLNVTEDDLAFWRGAGLGPVWLNIEPDTIRYLDSKVHQWLVGQLDHPAPTLNVTSSDDGAAPLQKEQLPDVDSGA